MHESRPITITTAGRAALAAGALLLTACGVFRRDDPAPAPVTTARADIRDAQGQRVGTATFRQTPNGVLVVAELSGVPTGTHGFHIHETGRCDPTFEAAGGHFDPFNREHGFLDPAGAHAGDLPNVHITSGPTRVEYLVPDITLSGGNAALLDRDGAAVVVHALADDYTTDPAGAAGARIACGVLTR